MEINRRMTQLIKLGNSSLVTSIPWELRSEWNLKKGDPLIWYWIGNLSVLAPLAYLGVIGEPKIVRDLYQLNQPKVP